MATYFLDPNADVIADWIETPTGADWSTIDDGTRQPSTPSGSDYLSAGAAKTTRVALTTFTLGGTEVVTSVKAWAYLNPSGSGSFTLALYKGATQIATGTISGTGWQSVTYTGALTQAEIDDLRISLDWISGSPQAWAAYAEVTASTPTAWTKAIDDTLALADASGRVLGKGIPDTLALADSTPTKAITKRFGFGTWADIEAGWGTWLDVRIYFPTWAAVVARPATGETAFMTDSLASTLVHGNFLTLGDSVGLADEIVLSPAYARTKALADTVALLDSISVVHGGGRRFRGML